MATSPRRQHGSWASVRRPSARSRRRAVPYSDKEARMPDLREVFELTTKQMGEPDVDSWREQEKRQRKTNRSKKIGAIAVAAVLAGAGVVLGISTLGGDGAQPASPSSDSTPTP